jgi:Phage integrase family
MPELLTALEFERERRNPAPNEVVLLSPVTGLPMSPRKLTARIQALGKRAGIARATPHCFRDTFAVDLLHKGVDIFTVAKLLGDTVAVVEKRYARFVTELRERAQRMMVSSVGLEGTIQDTIEPGIPLTEENKELKAAGPVSRIRRAALQTGNLFENQPPRTVNDVNFGSDGRFCITPASQMR